MAKIMDVERGFHLRIRTLYDIEKQLEEALPKMAEAATSPELVKGLLMHAEETKEHSRRLEQIFTMLEVAPEMHAGDAIRGLISDGKSFANAEAPDSLRDVLIAGSGRGVEHYEMACYLNAIEEAEGLGYSEAVELLETTLAEEVAAEEKLEIAFTDNLLVASNEMVHESE
jgi:ferritin-like metal-binding protein YciE